MAYQPKSYRKFIATAATATMVAGAVAPLATFAAETSFKDATGIYKTPVEYLVEKGFVNGVSKDEFGVSAKVKRGDAAVILSKALGLYATQAPDAGFTDLAAKYKDAVNPLKAAGIISGKTATEFKPDDFLTRGEVAIILAKAYKLEAKNEEALPFTDVNKNYAPFVKALVDNKVANGTTATTFGTASDITRGQMAIFLYNAINVDTTDKVAPVIKLTGDAAVSVDFGAEYKDAGATATDNVDKTVDVKWEIKDAAGKVVDKIDTKVAGKYTITYTAKDAAGNEAKPVTREVTVKENPAAKVESVSAINANKIKVTFNKEVDTTKATFEVKKSGVAIAVTPEFSADKKSAVLTKTSGNFVAGDYTVTVGGIEKLENASSNLTIADQKVTKIEVVGDAVKATNGLSATVLYKVYNQYGDDITKTVNVQATASDAVSTSVDSSKGQITLTKDFTATNAPKEVTLTLVDPQSAVNTSRAVKIADAATVSSFTLGEVSYPTGKTRVYENTDEAAKIAFEAKDQYGNDLANPTGAVQLFSSDTSAATFSFEKGSDNKYYIKVNTKDIVAAQDVTLTAVNVKTGAAVTKTLRVELAATPTTVELGDLNTDVLAAGDTAYINLVVKDQFGSELAPKDYATSADEALLGITGTAPLTSAQMSIVTDKYDKNYGKLKVEPVAKGNATIVATLGGKTVTKSVQVKDARVVAEVVAPSGASVVQGATANLGFKFFDQYGKEITSLANTSDMSYKITLTKVDGDDNSVILNTIALSDAESNLANGVSVTADAAKKGSYKVKVELFNKNLLAGAVDPAARVVSSAETTVKSVANNAEGLTYSVDAVSALAFDANYGNGAVDGTNPYAKAIKIVGTDKDGNKLTINPNQILDVTTVGDASTPYVQVGKVTTADATTVDAQEGKWVIAAKKLADKDTPADIKVKVTLNTADGVKVLYAPVTVSSEAPKAADVMIINKAVEMDDPTALADDYTVVDTLSFDTAADAIRGTETASTLDAAKVFVTVKDQFGVYKNVPVNFIVNTPSLFNFGTGANDKFATTSNGAFTLTDSGTDAQFTAGAVIKLSALVGDKSATIGVKILAEAPPTLTTALNGTTGVTSGTPRTIVFSEQLSASSKAAVESALVAGLTGTTADKVTFGWSAGTLTITNADTTNVAKFAAKTLKVKDLFNNESADLAIVTVTP